MHAVKDKNEQPAPEKKKESSPLKKKYDKMAERMVAECMREMEGVKDDKVRANTIYKYDRKWKDQVHISSSKRELITLDENHFAVKLQMIMQEVKRQAMMHGPIRPASLQFMGFTRCVSKKGPVWRTNEYYIYLEPRIRVFKVGIVAPLINMDNYNMEELESMMIGLRCFELTVYKEKDSPGLVNMFFHWIKKKR